VTPTIWSATGASETPAGADYGVTWIAVNEHGVALWLRNGYG
jgi:hypothetical protein